MKKITTLVAVYGSLRKNMHNHHILENSKYIGNFSSEPIYTMYNIRDQYPAVIEEGNTSIEMEVYDVNEKTQRRLNELEGYSENYEKGYNYYEREIIETPYGWAYIYLFNNDVDGFNIIESGDWVSYKKNEEKNQINMFSEWD